MSNTSKEGGSGSMGYSPAAGSSTSASSRMPQPSPRKQKNESPPVPDSTTEPPPVQVPEFQDGDDVFFRTDNGQQVLGTVGQIVGQRCQILFGDGTEEWSSFKRVKKMSTFLEEEKNKSLGHSKAVKKVPNADLVSPPATQAPTRPLPVELSCASCGVTRKISAKKAKAYEPGTDNLFQCRKCVNQQDSSPHSIGNMARATNANSLGTYMVSSPPLPLTKLPPDISIIPMSKSSSFSLPSTSAAHSSKGFTKSPTTTGEGFITIPRQIQFSVLPASNQQSACFNCNKPAGLCDRVHCKICDSACHLLCLALNPSPLSGDKFWDLLCSSCGNQKTSEKTKVFSVRRSISSWSDIAHLLISCLSVRSGQRMFDLDLEMMTFLANNIDRLHLPRQYKSSTTETQQKCLLNALSTSKMRFVNGREVKEKPTVWALRADTPMANISYNQETKKLINNIALGMGLKPSGQKVNQKVQNTGKLHVPTMGMGTSKSASGTGTSMSGPSTSTVQETNKGVNTQKSFTAENSSQHGRLTISITKKTSEIEVSNRGPARVSGAALKTSHKQISESSSKKNSVKRGRKRGASFDSETDSSKSASVMDIQSSQTVGTKESESKRGRKHTSSKSLVSPSPKKPKILKHSPTKNRDSKEVTATRIPLPKKIKLEKFLTQGQPGESKPNTEKVVKTEPGPHKPKTELTSGDSSSESSKDSEEAAPRAIKTAAFVPPPAPQILQEIKTSPKLSPSASTTTPVVVSRRTGKPGRPRNSTVAPIVPQIPKPEPSPLVSQVRTRGRGRGRPVGSKSQPKGGPGLKNINLKLTVRPNGITVSKSSNNGAPLTVSRRVGIFNSISERRPSQLVPQNTEPSTNTLNVISSSLLDAAIFGNYRMECLPRSPQTEAEHKTEELKVFAHIRAERENEVAAVLLSRSETETRCQTRRKAELFVGRQKRDLNDFESYDIVAKRVDEDGVTRYQVLWKGNGMDWEDDEEDEAMVVDTFVSNARHSSHSTSNVLTLNSPNKNANIREEEGLRRLVSDSKSNPVPRKSLNPQFIIDLTEDSN